MNNIRYYRLHKKISKYMLVKQTGLTYKTISNAEDCCTDVKISTLRRIADALGVGVEDLVEDME